MTNIGHNSGVTIDLNKERAFIARVGRDWANAREEAILAARSYIIYGLKTRNFDLCRALFEAVPQEAQGKLRRWLVAVAPIEARTKKGKGTTFGIDVQRAKENGFTVYTAVPSKPAKGEPDITAWNAGFMNFRPVKEEGEAPSLDEILTAAAGRLEKLGESLAEAGAPEAVLAALRAAHTACAGGGFVYTGDVPALPGQAA